MRKLHFVGLTADLEGLIFTARLGSKSGGYIVPLDGKLLVALDEVHRRHGGETSTSIGPQPLAGPDNRLGRAASALTPREMQARLRAGRSIEEVAEEAGVGTDWVERFAVPILAEQAQIVELAKSLTYAKPRVADSSQPLAASVSWNLSDRAVWLGDDQFDQSWSAHQLHDSVWMIRFRHRSRGRAQEALWELDVPAGRLVARNRSAADLGFVEKGRRRADASAATEEDVEEAGAKELPVPAEVAARPSGRPRGRPGRTATKSLAAVKTTRPTRSTTRTSAVGQVRAPAKATNTAKATSTAKATKATKAVPATPAKDAAKTAMTAKTAKTAKTTKTAKTAKTAKTSGTVGSPSPARGSAQTPRSAKSSAVSGDGPASPARAGGAREAVAKLAGARVAASQAMAQGRSTVVRPALGRPPAGRPSRRPPISDSALMLAPNGDEGGPGRAEPQPDAPPFAPRPMPTAGAARTPNSARPKRSASGAAASTAGDVVKLPSRAGATSSAASTTEDADSRRRRGSRRPR